jgi:hypothetical protein
MIMSPCFNCTERHRNCHSECEKYQEFHRIRETIITERAKNNAFANYSINAVKRGKK